METGSAPLEFISHNRSDDGESRDKVRTGRISLEQRTNYLMHCSIVFPILPLKYGWTFYFRGKKSYWQGVARYARPLSVQFLSFSCSFASLPPTIWKILDPPLRAEHTAEYTMLYSPKRVSSGPVDLEICDRAGGGSRIHQRGGANLTLYFTNFFQRNHQQRRITHPSLPLSQSIFFHFHAVFG